MKKIILILIIIFLAMFFYTFLGVHKSSREYLADVVYDVCNDEYQGKVIEMYTDSLDHAKKKVVLEETKGEKLISFYSEKNYFFDKIKVGDSLVKEKGSLL